MTNVNPYIPLNVSDASSVNDMLQIMNNSGGGWLFAAINFLVFMVLFITLTIGFGWESALITSSFISVIIGLFLVYLGLMNYIYWGISVGVLLVMIMYVIWANKYD